MKYKPYPSYTPCVSLHYESIPGTWGIRKMRQAISIKKEIVGENCKDYTLLSLTLEGIIPRDLENPKGKFPEEFDTYQKVEPTDIVLCLFDVEETPRGVGFSDYLGMVTGAYTVVETKQEYWPKYFYWYYFAFDQTKSFKAYYTGLRNVIRKDTLYTIPIPLPPLATQRAIAAFLDAETAQIDGLIKDYEDLIELLKEKRQALISHAVTRGLSELVSPDDPEFGEWAKPVKFKDSGVEWIGEIPEGWERIILKYFCDVRDGTHYTPEYVNEEDESYPFITSKDLVKGEVCFDDVKYISRKDYLDFSSRSKVARGDILMPMIGSIGGAVIVNTDLEFSIKNVALFKKGDLYFNKWLLYIIDSEIVRIQLDTFRSGGVQSFVGLSILRGLAIPFPSLADQAAIATFLDRETSKLETLVTESQSAIELLKEHRSALITEAVTGKINVEG